MVSNAERRNPLPDAGAEAQLPSTVETNQPKWDVPALLQSDSRRAGLFAQPEPQKDVTFTSPYSSPLKAVRHEPTTMEILNKPLTELNANDLSIVSRNAIGVSKDWLSTVDSDYAGIGGFVVRFKSEMLSEKFPTNSSMIRAAAAVPLAGVSGYMLKNDVESFGKTTSIGQKAYYATASTVDATALAGTVGTFFPQTRAAARATAALSFLARAGMGWTHHTFFPDEQQSR